jgi:hypothetical protein
MVLLAHRSDAGASESATAAPNARRGLLSSKPEGGSPLTPAEPLGR